MQNWLKLLMGEFKSHTHGSLKQNESLKQDISQEHNSDYPFKRSNGIIIYSEEFKEELRNLITFYNKL